MGPPPVAPVLAAASRLVSEASVRAAALETADGGGAASAPEAAMGTGVAVEVDATVGAGAGATNAEACDAGEAEEEAGGVPPVGMDARAALGPVPAGGRAERAEGCCCFCCCCWAAGVP